MAANRISRNVKRSRVLSDRADTRRADTARGPAVFHSDLTALVLRRRGIERLEIGPLFAGLEEAGFDRHLVDHFCNTRTRSTTMSSRSGRIFSLLASIQTKSLVNRSRVPWMTLRPSGPPSSSTPAPSKPSVSGGGAFTSSSLILLLPLFAACRITSRGDSRFRGIVCCSCFARSASAARLRGGSTCATAERPADRRCYGGNTHRTRRAIFERSEAGAVFAPLHLADDWCLFLAES